MGHQWKHFGQYFGFLVAFCGPLLCVIAQDYEVADIDCAIGKSGSEHLTAKLRKPEGFRGIPIFADDRGSSMNLSTKYTITPDSPCQILPDPEDPTGRVFQMKITDFGQCGVLKRNGFIHVRVWFPQLPGVVMLSDQEVIIMCKPPSATIIQSKAAGFAGSIPSGARVSGIVEETPGRLEYEVALYRETNSNTGRSAPGAGAFITGANNDVPVDQAVPIGTRLQLRARISPKSAWQHAKLMEVSVSPDPKNAYATGSVSLVTDGCRNSELSSIIPKQPYRYKDLTNEIVLDFEAFLLSNMGEKNTLWLHTQIKACMEAQDCSPEFCMDVFQPSGYGRKKRSLMLDEYPQTFNDTTALEYKSALRQHWKAELNRPVNGSASTTSYHSRIESDENGPPVPTPVVPSSSKILPPLRKTPPVASKMNSVSNNEKASTKFGDNLGFSVIMPADYYRSSERIAPSFECSGWAAATMLAVVSAMFAASVSCILSYKMKKAVALSNKERNLFGVSSSPTSTSMPQANSQVTRLMETSSNKVPFSHSQYARDSSVYRP